jgi:hypothetical protein
VRVKFAGCCVPTIGAGAWLAMLLAGTGLFRPSVAYFEISSGLFSNPAAIRRACQRAWNI